LASLDVEITPQFYWGKKKSFSMRKTSYCGKEDYAADQISIKEYFDPFTGDKNRTA